MQGEKGDLVALTTHGMRVVAAIILKSGWTRDNGPRGFGKRQFQVHCKNPPRSYLQEGKHEACSPGCPGRHGGLSAIINNVTQAAEEGSTRWPHEHLCSPIIPVSHRALAPSLISPLGGKAQCAVGFALFFAPSCFASSVRRRTPRFFVFRQTKQTPPRPPRRHALLSLLFDFKLLNSSPSCIRGSTS